MGTTVITNEAKGIKFGEYFEESLKSAVNVEIATGYIGHSSFLRVKDQLERIVQNGGFVSVTIGLGYFEGLTKKMIDALRDFDAVCRAVNPDSGVNACVYSAYHGKIFIIEQEGGETIASVGSSNFSSSGFGDWLEGNLLTSDYRQVTELKDYLRRLLDSNALPIDGVDFVVRGRKSLKTKTLSGEENGPKKFTGELPDPTTLSCLFSIPLRVTERSNFNQYLTARKSYKDDPAYKHLDKENRPQIEVLQPRPWYEMEVTIRQEDISDELRRFLPDQKEAHSVTLVTQDGYLMQGKFSRKSSKRHHPDDLDKLKAERRKVDDPRTLKKTALDFMTSPRSHLGFVLKGALMEEGLLKFGEPVTQDILRDANMLELSFFDIGDGKLFVTF